VKDGQERKVKECEGRKVKEGKEGKEGEERKEREGR
jgi:hypothetical protein